MIISQNTAKAICESSVFRSFELKSLSFAMLASKATTTLTASPGFHSAFIKSYGSLWTIVENGGGQLAINSY